MFSTETLCFPPDLLFFTETPCFPPDPAFSIPCVFHLDPVFSTETLCFPLVRPCIFHTPCFPPNPMFSTQPPVSTIICVFHISGLCTPDPKPVFSTYPRGFGSQEAFHFTPMHKPQGGGGDFHMKQMGMLVVSPRGVNFGFWSRLGCFRQSANILCRQGLV